MQTTITKRHDRRFNTPAREAAKLLGEELASRWLEGMTLFDAAQDYCEVWRLKSGRFLTISTNRSAFTARVTEAAPCAAGQAWEKPEYRAICQAAGVEWDFMPALLADEALDRQRQRMGL